MKEELLQGTSHTDDSIWYRIKGNDKSYTHLNDIFDFYDIMYGDPEMKPLTYYQKARERRPHFTIDEDNVLAYFILTNKLIHIILRKVGKWKTTHKKIIQKFRYPSFEQRN